MPVKQLETDDQFPPELTAAGDKSVVVDFFATWCPPCRAIAPRLEEFSNQYPGSVFLKVDVDKCPETMQHYGITAMPTFMIFQKSVKVDEWKGADPDTLKEKLENWCASAVPVSVPGLAPGQLDLNPFLVESELLCLNQEGNHPFQHALKSGTAQYLESDCDQQLIIAAGFNQVIKLHSLKLHAPPDRGPKTVKVFINQPNAMDFDTASSQGSVQTLELTPEDLKEDAVIPLLYVKFQRVQSVTLFVDSNQEDSEEPTKIFHVAFYGSPVCTTNMGDFKRVAGKEGDSH